MIGGRCDCRLRRIRCGGGSDREQIDAAVKGYLGGLADGDGDSACCHLTPSAHEILAIRVRASSCRDAVERIARS